jgi:hypothetical protein
MAETEPFSPSTRAGHVGLSAPEPPPDFRPERHNPHCVTTLYIVMRAGYGDQRLRKDPNQRNKSSLTPKGYLRGCEASNYL